MTKIKLLGVAALFTAPLIFADVKTDYDHSAQFSRYRTFAWKLPTAQSNGMVDNSIVSSRIRSSVDRELMRKGMEETNRNPDVYITYRISGRHERQVNYLTGPGWGYGWGYRRWGWGPPSVMVNDYTRGTLILDMIDARTGRLVWRAVGTNTGSNILDVQSEKKVDKLVRGALKAFPPKPDHS